MKSEFKVAAKAVQAIVLLLGMAFCPLRAALAGEEAPAAAEKQPFEVKGMFVEGCSCSAPCGCQLVGIEPMCEGVAALSISSGSYQGVKLDGAKIAIAMAPAKWVRVYVDATAGAQRDAAAAFGKAYAHDFGKIEEVKDGKVEIEGKDGKYTLKVDGGKVMNLSTEPVLGGDNKTPLVYSNIHDPVHPTIMQGKTLSGTFKDGGHSFELKGSNAYFHPGFENKGKL